MKSTGGTWILLATLAGCVSTPGSRYQGDSHFAAGVGGQANEGGPGCHIGTPPMVPGMVGPYGQPVPMKGPYIATPPSGTAAAQAMLRQSVPLDMMASQANFAPGRPLPAGIQLASGSGAADGSAIVQAGGLPPPVPPPLGFKPPPGAVAALGALTPGAPGAHFPSQRTEVRFVGPATMKISWYAPTPDGKKCFNQTPIEAPGRYNFVQAAIYRLKLSDIPNRPGLELYPTLEVVPANAKSATFLAHSAVPVSFTDDDFDQVTRGSMVVKVIYLPDPQFQDQAALGTDELVSSPLQPGLDPIAEAARRGSILLVVKLGNIDLEAPNTPPMDAPSPYRPAPPPAVYPPPGYAPRPPMLPPGTMGPQVPMPPNGMMPSPGGMTDPNSGTMPPNNMIPPQNGAVPPGRMMMGPNGPMMMGPNGPIMMGPNGQMMQPGSGQMMQPGGGLQGGPPFQPGTIPGQTLPPSPGGAIPPQQPSAGPNIPLGQLPDAGAVQQTDLRNAFSPPTPAELVRQRGQ